MSLSMERTLDGALDGVVLVRGHPQTVDGSGWLVNGAATSLFLPLGGDSGHGPLQHGDKQYA